MITNSNVVVTSRGPITVRIQHDARFYRGVAALLDGDATHDRPLHFVLLACHADMADEAEISTTQRLTISLAEEVLTRLRTQQGDITAVLQASNVAAVATDRYYSVAAGHVTSGNVIVGALGSVDAIVVKGSARQSIITPNVVRIGEHPILNGAFGLGFKEEAVQVKQLDLENEGMLLLVIGDDGAVTGSGSRHQNAEAFIEEVVSAARVSPPIVALVR